MWSVSAVWEVRIEMVEPLAVGLADRPCGVRRLRQIEDASNPTPPLTAALMRGRGSTWWVG